MSRNIDKMSASDLKNALKAAGMSQSGDKGTLQWRLKIFETCEAKSIRVDGQNPCSMRFVELKKWASKEGVSPIGNQDEIMDAFVKVLLTKPQPQSESQSTGITTASSSSAQGDGKVDAVAVAIRIIELAEQDDYEGILNIAAMNPSHYVTKKSPISSMRKLYLKLSLLVHPDKLSKLFDQATKAFQALVRAFDTLSSPTVEIEEEPSKGQGKTKKAAAISRSNEGCYRTRVCCPRCRQPWSEGTLDGNPDYFYNFLMQGLKSYTCSTCLCEFGCMTAIHRCPSCNKVYEYSIEDYHRKIECSNAKCRKVFGFYLFHVHDRIIRDLKIELKELQEKRIKERESKQRRARLSSRMTDQESERAFMLGLVDCCPRCGEDLEGYHDEESQREHLMNCTDTTKHAEHKKKVAEKVKKEEEKEAQRQKQEDAQTLAAWSLLGSNSSQLWLLDAEHVRQRALAVGVDAGGTKDEIIMKIVTAEREREGAGDGDGDERAGQGSHSGHKRKTGSSLLITDGGSSSSSHSTSVSGGAGVLMKVARRRRLSAESLPSNMHSMGAAQLRSVCAANGIVVPASASKQEILDMIEDELFD